MILILGANGQVGRSLSQLLDGHCIALTREQADLSKPYTLPDALSAYQPAAIVNAAAYTQVDKAEEEEELAFAINATAPRMLAGFCRDRHIPLVHFSTDYVFDGNGNEPWSEDDSTAPINAYGRSKEAGEEAIIETGGQYLIFRTSWVYDETGKNFLNTMLRLGAERPELRVVADQYGAPTYARQLAAKALDALQAARTAEHFPSGLYHLCHGGETTWHGFAEAIFSEARKHGEKLAVQTVHAIDSADYPTPAARPHNSRLSCSKAKRVLGIALPAWQDGLAACMKQKYASHIHAA